MVNTKLNLSMTEPYVRQIYAKEGDTGRVLEIGLEDYPTENGTLRILRPDGVEVTADAIKSASGDAYKGDLVTFDALEEVPLTKCEVTLSPKQDLSNGDPSPTNICPIYPSNGKNLVNIGGSVFDTQQNPTTALPLASYSLIKGFAYTGYVRPNNITSFSASGTTITLTTKTSDYGVGMIAEVEVGKTYTFSATHDGYVVFAYYDASGFFVSNENKGTQGLYSTTVPSGAKYLIVLIRGATAGTSNISIDKPQLEQGSTATPYVPYQGINVYQSGEDTTDYTTYPLSLGQSVYGGTLDVVSGKLTIDKVSVDLGSLSWTKGQGASASNVRYYTNGINATVKKPPNNYTKVDGISSCWIITTVDYGYTGNSKECLCVNTGGQVSIYTDLPFTDATDFQTQMNGQQFVYALATPIEVDLTPTQISTLLGTNNIWSSGEVEVAFEYDGLFAQLPEEATEVVGRCLGDVDFNGASTMPFTLVVKPNNKE